jgi:hypothetical protein
MIRSMVLMIAFAAAGVVLGSGTAGADDLVDLPSGSTATLPAEAAAVIFVPVAPTQDVAAGSLTATPLRVMRDGMPTSAQVTEAIKVGVERAIPALRFDVDIDTLGRAGDYTVSVSVGSGQRFEVVDVVLKRAGADLRAPATIDITRTVWFPQLGIGGWRDELPALRLLPGRGTRVTQLAVTELDSSTDRIVVSGLESIDPIRTNQPGRTLDYAITGTTLVPAQQRDEANAVTTDILDAVRGHAPLADIAGKLPNLLKLVTPTPLGSMTVQPTTAPRTRRRQELASSPTRTVTRSRISLGSRTAVATGIMWITSLARFLVLGLILSLLAYYWMAPTWTGTLSDILVVFTWAFALDVSVTAVTTAMTTRPAQLTPTTIQTQQTQIQGGS